MQIVRRSIHFLIGRALLNILGSRQSHKAQREGDETVELCLFSKQKSQTVLDKFTLAMHQYLIFIQPINDLV